MKITKPDEIVTGYKATDKNMKCMNFQFELGKWYSHDGPVELCKSGFHFCVYPSGSWVFYSSEGTRIFKVEANIFPSILVFLEFEPTVRPESNFLG